MMKTFLESLVEEGTKTLLSRCETLLENGTIYQYLRSDANTSGRCVPADCREGHEREAIAVEATADGSGVRSERDDNVGER
jgi:hypothetical protein